MTKSREEDQLLYGLIAVVFAAIAFLIAWNIPNTGLKRLVTNTSPTRQAIDANSPSEMVQQLQQTVDDGGKSDIIQIENATSGL